MLKKLQTIFKVFVIIISLTVVSKAELLNPNSNIAPSEVVKIQLTGLQKNDLNFKDSGIEQTWKFAHPNNKKVTGPLEKFKKMIYSENYKMLIEHESSEVTILSENSNTSVYKVFILSSDKKKYSYIWHIEKVQQQSDLLGCWMTTIVSNPEYLGEVI